MLSLSCGYIVWYSYAGVPVGGGVVVGVFVFLSLMY